MLLRKLILVVALLALLPACARQEKLYKETRVIMGTYITITAVRDGLTEQRVSYAVDAAFREIDRVDRLMSTYKPVSELSELNRRAGIRSMKVDPEVVACVGDALYTAELTGGAFDPTIGPLVKLWGIGGKSQQVPAPGDIKRAKSLVDYREVLLNRNASKALIRIRGMSIDLGGVAKGYASDLAVAKLKEIGVQGGIVAVAGDLKLFGLRPNGKEWSIGIQHPREKGTLLTRLTATDCAVSTSGDYERYFMKGGVRYHHIIDPRTGYPARGLVSVTVLSKDSWLSDSLATGLFVMGPERAWKLANAHPEFEVLMITSEGKVLATGRFKELNIGRVNLE